MWCFYWNTNTWFFFFMILTYVVQKRNFPWITSNMVKTRSSPALAWAQLCCGKQTRCLSMLVCLERSMKSHAMAVQLLLLPSCFRKGTQGAEFYLLGLTLCPLQEMQCTDWHNGGGRVLIPAVSALDKMVTFDLIFLWEPSVIYSHH